jgi:pimeloyl-ACP methyl ester carboxylesterase
MASSDKKPTLIIVHGAWHRPIHFQLVTAELHKHGYKTIAPALPSVDKAPDFLVADSTEDIDAVRAAILSELDGPHGGNNVILIPHSYGGLPASAAVEGLDTLTRKSQGKQTSVVAIAALTSFILPKDMDLPTIEQRPRPKRDTSVAGPPPTSLFWHDVPQGSEMDKWATESLGPMSMAALYDSCRFSAFNVVPVHYLVAEADKAIPLATQERIISTIEEQGGGKVRVERLEGCAHSPFLSRVEETVAFIRRSAGEKI